ncbi:galactose-binding protein [Riemerella anatipestifer]|uniref:galactose-binding protein n=1 Tax=Riemerella anatipestifer TaxID=34085 RepID=UPI002363557B|nr:galactose-binding protein [Riemerella anatipestifer]MDD1539396.1 galactose-binding protein [Riemerella anatipestifer]
MTNEVLYNLNGKYFKDFGVFISESKGLLDKPKLKSKRSYDWAEYHGKAVDLDKPKYDEREIELKGWVEGETWPQMKTNFDTLLSELDKEGLQRLVIEYLGNALVFDVYLSGGVELEKSFKEGKMVGVFTLKMKDPNPIKKVFKLIGSDLQLSFNAQSWVDINIDGINETRRGNITINKAVPSRELSGYGYCGRNLILNSKGSFSGRTDIYGGVGWFIFSEPLKQGESYVFTYKNDIPYPHATIRELTLRDSEGNVVASVFPNENNEFRFVAKANNIVKCYLYADWKNAYYGFSNLKLEKGNRATDWTPAPEDTHYITISGNIDEITNLQTNAEEL